MPSRMDEDGTTKSSIMQTYRGTVTEDKDNIECDFREMTRMNEATTRGKMKRLQDGPRVQKREEELKKRTGKVLTKIIMKIQESLPEMQMEKAGKRFTKSTNNTRRMDKTGTAKQSYQMEACQILMDKMNLNEPNEEMCRMMDTLRLGEIKKKLEDDDLSYWDELEVLNEEDFSSQEEQRELLIAEKLLMEQIITEKMKDGGAVPTTETPEQPCVDQFQTSEDENETNKFLNTEYSKQQDHHTYQPEAARR